MANLTKLMNKENRIFMTREWLSLLIMGVLVTVGNLYESVPMLMAAAVFITFTILRSDVANAFYWALVLVPNLRMLDIIGVEYLVNVMMALPLVVYLLRCGIRRLSAVALLGGIVLLLMEVLHDAVLNDMKNLINIGGWVLNFVLCILITVDSRVELSVDDVFSALSAGIIMSMVMFLLSNAESVAHILETLESDNRLEAFADDPNAYSLYAVLAIACVVNVRGHNIYKFVTVVVLIGIGLLTASKMGLLTILIELFLIFLQVFGRNKENKKLRKFLGWSFAGVATLAIWLRDYVKLIIRNFFRRAGTADLQSLDMGRFTTGRSVILADYFEILGTNAMCLLFGYGFNYNKHLNQAREAIAHNTYMDLILTWGILGAIVFVGIIYLWIKDFVQHRGIQKIRFVQHIPLITMLITFMALSCLSASMLPFVLAVAFIQWLPDIKKETA